jgi:uncharacterized protein (DUF433 family)
MKKTLKKELHKIISVNPHIRNGVPCFSGTRVPVSWVFNQLVGGWSLDEILADIPEVKKSQINSITSTIPDILKLILTDDKKINSWSRNR